MLPSMSRSIPLLHRVMAHVQRRSVRRATLVLALAGAMAVAAALGGAKQRSEVTSARLETAAEQLESLTEAVPANDDQRAAIAWGYAQRLRLGLESPFRLIELAASDPRLTLDERYTVSWALLARVVRGETHEVEAAALDLIGPSDNGRIAAGEQHLALITSAILTAENPRAAELAVRFAYMLASAERIIDGSGPLLAAEAAAMIADREIARREASDVVRAATNMDAMEVVRRRRARRSFYIERPVLLAPGKDLEREAIAQASWLLDSLRSMRPLPPTVATGTDDHEEQARAFAPQLFAAGKLAPPSAPLAVTVQRYHPLLKSYAPRVDAAALKVVTNGEMLVATMRVEDAGRPQRRAIGRLLLAAGVSMRSFAQDPVGVAGDSVPLPSASAVASTLGLSRITFDLDVPSGWRPYLIRSLADGVHALRRVLPLLKLDAVQVRFRMSAPADSALAMHDPRTRTLHLPATTAGGTLLHELAHELDRQSADQQGLPGYRSDMVARGDGPRNGWIASSRTLGGGGGRVAASLRALTEELTDQPRAARVAERPAEIFATRVDWFVAQALAREGISNGFLTGVQDELLTGHVVHPERLRTAGRARSLLDALEGMTTVAPFARQDQEPSVQTLLRWSLGGPVDRRVAADIVRGEPDAWTPTALIGEQVCDDDESGRVQLVRMAAESRARGWLRQRARWVSEEERPAWARAVLRQGPWTGALAQQRVAELRDYVLVQLASSAELPAGLSAYATPLAVRARCA